MKANPTPQTDRASQSEGKKVLDYHRVADYVYEVVIHSESRGQVTRRVLVLPGSAMGEPLSGGDCNDE
jgi:hypothetical protein